MMTAEEQQKHRGYAAQIEALDKQKPKPFPTALAIERRRTRSRALVFPAPRQHRASAARR